MSWSVFLSSSIPREERDPRFLKPVDSAFEVTQAVLSLVSAVLEAGGTFVFGGQPAITPLVVQVAEEWYATVENPGKPLILYQSSAYQDWFVPEIAQLSEAPYCELNIIRSPYSAVPGDPRASMLALHELRNAMLSHPDLVGMFVVGGMEGVLQEATLFHLKHHGRPIYALEPTGGAASLLANRWKPSPTDAAIAQTPLEESLIKADLSRWRTDVRPVTRERIQQISGFSEGEKAATFPALPYPVIMAVLLDEMRRESGEPRANF